MSAKQPGLIESPLTGKTVEARKIEIQPTNGGELTAQYDMQSISPNQQAVTRDDVSYLSLAKVEPQAKLGSLVFLQTMLRVDPPDICPTYGNSINSSGEYIQGLPHLFYYRSYPLCMHTFILRAIEGERLAPKFLGSHVFIFQKYI